MARNINIAVDCSDCCTCPAPQSLLWQSRSVSKTKAGFYYAATPDTFYLTCPMAFTFTFTAAGPLQRYAEQTFSGENTYDPGATPGSEYTIGVTLFQQEGYPFSICSGVIDPSRDYTSPFGYGFGIDATFEATNLASWCFGDGPKTVTLEDEYTTTLLLSYAATALAAASWSGGTPGSYRALSTDELTVNLRESRYQIPFKIPLVGSGLDYRVSWVERFIPAAGVPIDGIDVIFPGVYRPAVTLAAPPSGGVQATAIAVMSSTGTVSSIRVLNPGSGYATAPAVTVASAISGGTTSTGWTATLTGNRVVSITGGSAGDYRPQLAFSGGGGSGATATCTVDETGGLATVTLTAPGSSYTSAPNLSINARSSGATAAVLHLHFGTETAKCDVWDGITPGGYDPFTPSTYPVLPSSATYYTVPMPTANGITLPANIVAVCDASACP